MTLGIALPGTALGLWRNPVAALFSTGEQGAWYDPSDFSTMYQDSAGTTPVTAVGQPVGLMLDKRLGAVRGAELVVPGDWATGAGVTNNAGVLTSNIAAGSIALVANQSEPMTSGGWYEYTGTISNYTSGALILFLGDTQATIFPAANGAFRTIFQAGASNVIQINCTAEGFVGTISGTSVKSLFGNHRTQATAASRPTLRQDASGFYNGELDGVDDSWTSTTGGGGTAGFFYCASIKPSGGAGTARTLFSDTGTNTGYRVRINASNQLELAAGNGTAFTTVATAGTLSVGTTYVISAWDDGVNLNVQIDNGTVAQAARPAVSAGTAEFTIGKDNGAASSFYTGALYQDIYRQGVAPDVAYIARVKRFAASRAGVSL